MAKITLRKHWVRTDPWRGYYEYENSVADGCFLSGDNSHNQSEMDRIHEVRKALRQNRIPNRLKTAQTSNVFSRGYDIVVAKEDVQKAKKVLEKVI